MSIKKVRLPRKIKKSLKKFYQTADADWYIVTSLYCGWLHQFSPGSQARYKGKIKGWRDLVVSREHFSGFKMLDLNGELNIEILEEA